MALSSHKIFFDAHGYAVVPSLFIPDEAALYRDHFMRLRHAGTYPGDLVADDHIANDPLKRHPRMIHMHRWDAASRAWLLDRRLGAHLTALFDGIEPLAVQTMVYFKPPGARGQALHQDNYYLRVSPGTCIAAWLALDGCDEANGCMRVVPGSHRWPILCTQPADAGTSFTDVTVPLPAGHEAVSVLMQPGDVLFFHGALVHGSLPNTTPDRFRRALIGHYIDGRAAQVTQYDQPVLRMDGSERTLTPSPGGGPCGVWVNRNGTPVIEESGVERTPVKSHE